MRHFRERKEVSHELVFEEDAIHVDVWYPSSDGQKYVEVGLMHVRAADDIRVSYDLERDGWVIEQDAQSEDGSRAWVEVAFLKAWAAVNNKTDQGGR
jgi:hypothetical protein